MPESLQYLEQYDQILKNEQFETKLYRPSSEFPVPFLVVNLGDDNEGRPRLLKLVVKKQGTNDSFMPKDPILHLQFELEYPYLFEPIAAKEVGSILHFLNNQTKFTAFCMDEVNLNIYYRYDMFATETSVNADILIAILGIIMLTYDLYSKAIEDIAKGNKTFNEVIEEVITAYQELKKVL